MVIVLGVILLQHLLVRGFKHLWDLKVAWDYLLLQQLLLMGFKTLWVVKVRKKGKIRNRYNQAPHLIQDTNGKVIT